MARRRRLIYGNFKMQLGIAATRAWLADVLPVLEPAVGVEAVVFPSFVCLAVAKAAVGGAPLGLGAQDVSPHGEGAYTGDVSASMLREAGCSHVLVAHSERRRYHGEDDELARRKLRAALDSGLRPVYCVGESLEQYDRGEAAAVVAGQVRTGLEGFTPEEVGRVVVAYEPVWAIGTGRSARPEHAAQAAQWIRDEVATMYTREVAKEMPVLYGGSVSPSNVGAYLTQPGVDGVLAGGASQAPETYLGLLEAAR